MYNINWKIKDTARTAFERAKQTKKSPGPNGAGANKTQGPMQGTTSGLKRGKKILKHGI